MATDKTGKKETALESRSAEGEKLYSPSAARNRDPIRDVIVAQLAGVGSVLEIGSGTGEHAVHFAAAAPGLQWFAGDPDPSARDSIAAHIAGSGLENVSGPHWIDVCEEHWDAALDVSYGAVVSINMIHIAPFSAAEGLFAGAGRLLRPGGKLLLYGPFARNGVHTAPSNEAFDASLKARDPRWGIRDLEHDLAPLAHKNALRQDIVISMPANNFTVIFVKV